MFFQRIRDLREDNDLTQREIAEILNIPREKYSSWETGRVTFALQKLSDLADYYNVSLDYLLELNNTKRYTITPEKFNQNILSGNLRKARKKLRLTQENFATDLNIKQPSYISYEKGRTCIPTDKLYTLAKKYNLSIDEMLGKHNKNEI